MGVRAGMRTQGEIKVGDWSRDEGSMSGEMSKQDDEDSRSGERLR